MSDSSRSTRDGAVARVTLNRPQLHNAFDEALIAGLTRRLRALGEDAAVRVVVLAGAGKSFSAGADLDWMKRGRRLRRGAEPRRRARARADAAHHRRVPEAGDRHGATAPRIGGGVGLVAACDIAIAAERAQFAPARCGWASCPAVIAPFVVRAIGPREARRWFLTAERFDAAEALRIGLVHEVVPADRPRGAHRRHGGRRCSRAGRRRWPRPSELVQVVAHDAAGRQHPGRGHGRHDRRPRAPRPRARRAIAAFLEKRRPAWIEG